MNGPLIVDDVDLVIRAALDGVGLAYLGEDRAAPHLATGALLRVLEPWCQPFPGFFLYYPSRRQQPAALSALIETLRLEQNRRKRSTEIRRCITARVRNRLEEREISDWMCEKGGFALF